jgi:hypothetical protein
MNTQEAGKDLAGLAVVGFVGDRGQRCRLKVYLNHVRALFPGHHGEGGSRLHHGGCADYQEGIAGLRSLERLVQRV